MARLPEITYFADSKAETMVADRPAKCLSELYFFREEDKSQGTITTERTLKKIEGGFGELVSTWLKQKPNDSNTGHDFQLH